MSEKSKYYLSRFSNNLKVHLKGRLHEAGSRMKHKHSADEVTYEFEEKVCSRCLDYKQKHNGLIIDWPLSSESTHLKFD